MASLGLVAKTLSLMASLMDSAQAEELARRVDRWVRGHALLRFCRYDWNSDTLVLTIWDGVCPSSEITLETLVLDDPAQFAQFAQFEPSPERVEASQILAEFAAGAFPLPFPYLHSSLDSMFCLCCDL